VLLPWERLLWSDRPLRPLRRLRGEQYVLTDFRLIRIASSPRKWADPWVRPYEPRVVPARPYEEVVLHDIGDVLRTQSRLDRVLGTSTITVLPRRHGVAPIVVSGIRRGTSFAALLELLSGDPRAMADVNSVRAALQWNPQPTAAPFLGAAGALAAIAIALFAVVVGLHGKSEPLIFAADDAIAPAGMKRSRAEIMRFMETEVMPWARVTLGRVKGGADRVTCETCHGRQAAARDWQMPAVSALPLPDVRDRGWETYNGVMDAQMRNAIYGYVAESDNQAKAAYMREVVVPGMAGLLRRPAYDFTRAYDYNRARRALGCYHCHQVSLK
jgi:hypothetical protein